MNPTAPVVEQLFQRALERHRAGDREAARHAYEDLLAQHPGHVDALHMLGLLLHQSGDHAKALDLLDAAHAADPANTAILANRSSVHLALGNNLVAEADADAALQADPKSFGAAFNLGLARLASESFGSAADAFERASALRSQHARALLEWFTAAALSERGAMLRERVRRPLPNLIGERELALSTAAALDRAGYSNASFAVIARMHRELPQDPQVAYLYDVQVRYREACAFEYRNDSSAALAADSVLIAAAPWHCDLRRQHASLLGERGLAAEALAEWNRVASLAPTSTTTASARLIALQHDPSQTAPEIAAAHRAWGVAYTPIVAPSWTRDQRGADSERPLRVGWLSPRFFAGLAETFFASELGRLDKDTMTHVLYDSAGIDDAATSRFRAGADLWRRVDTLGDAALCAQIRSDEIDVLVELSGHSPGNRLRALAARPAPVQISWLDYFHSTGTAAIDFLLSDSVLSPPELLDHYSEHVLYLPSGRLCYSPPVNAPEVCDRKSKALRLACFNRLSKVNDEVLTAWAGILAALPGASLKLKMRAFDDTGHRTHFLARAAARGIEPEQLILSGYGTHIEALAAYDDVDIALDPFPFSGCATSCDALWMGVPVVTLIGNTMVSRQTASLLTALNLSDLIAHDVEDYQRRVCALAADSDRRRMLRSQLRQRMRTSIAAMDRHAYELSTALRSAWRSWCVGAQECGSACDITL